MQMPHGLSKLIVGARIERNIAVTSCNRHTQPHLRLSYASHDLATRTG